MGTFEQDNIRVALGIEIAMRASEDVSETASSGTISGAVTEAKRTSANAANADKTKTSRRVNGGWPLGGPTLMAFRGEWRTAKFARAALSAVSTKVDKEPVAHVLIRFSFDPRKG